MSDRTDSALDAAAEQMRMRVDEALKESVERELLLPSAARTSFSQVSHNKEVQNLAEPSITPEEELRLREFAERMAKARA